MGATTFEVCGKGKTAAEAFNILREEALHRYGHGGYTGSIAEKNKFREVFLPQEIVSNLKALNDKVYDLINTDFDDKYGPAGCIKLKEGEYYFFGWAAE
jgi:hypothetical protein